MTTAIIQNCRLIPRRKCRWTINRSKWLQKSQIHRCSFCKNVCYDLLQFVKKTIKKMRFLVIHDFIILTRHCQHCLVHKDDDMISCIYVEKLWRPISDIIIRRAYLISCALSVLISRIYYTVLKLHPSYMFFNLSIPVFYMNESVSRLNSDGEEGWYTGKKRWLQFFILWLTFSHSFSIYTSQTVQ